MRRDLNLQEVVIALRHMKNEKYPEGIIVAQDLGVHWRCSIQSNCPEAIKLNRMIAEMGLNLEEVLQAHDTYHVSPLERPVTPHVPSEEINGEVELIILNQRVKVDLTGYIRQHLDHQLAYKFDQVQDMERRVLQLGEGLWWEYQDAIRRAREAESLPQLTPHIRDLLKYGCYVSSDGHNYLFTFPFTYRPQYIYTRGARYYIPDSWQEQITRPVAVVFPVSIGYTIFTPYLISSDTGRKFAHYHGDAGDCWGDFIIPASWTGSIKDLSDIAYQIKAALATINLDSLMVHRPAGMPSVTDEIFEECEMMGMEGDNEDADMDEVEPVRTRRRWGQR